MRNLDRTVGDEYDLFVCALGYESRSRFIAESQSVKARRRIAMGFPIQQVLHYRDNSRWFDGAGFQIPVLYDHEVKAYFEQACKSLVRDQHPLRVCCDISSMSRYRIAVLVDSLRCLKSQNAVCADFVYASATFTAAPQLLFANSHVGPVLPSFAGWTAEPELPVSAIVGLGYEPDKALGAVEHLQASEVWTFEPVSMVTEFTGALYDANRTLLGFVPQTHRLQYRLERPYTLFQTLHALIGSCLRSSNPVILPFGPKLFSLISLLVASSYTDAAVWRVSASVHEVPIDRPASGFITGLAAEFLAGPDAEQVDPASCGPGAPTSDG